MSEMVERVARAMADRERAEHGKPPAVNASYWKLFEGMARAAIEAMREPTEAMALAGYTDERCQAKATTPSMHGGT